MTQLVKAPQSCPFCSQECPSHHALNVHIGKQHRECRTTREANPTIKKKRRDELRIHSLGGLPQCKRCLRKFYGWPQFMGHFDQQTCPILHRWRSESTAGAAEQTSDTAEGILAEAAPAPGDSSLHTFDTTPLLHRPELQTLAQQGHLAELAKSIAAAAVPNHCPEFFQWFSTPAYIARHANKMHEHIRARKEQVTAWVQAHKSLQKPCQFLPGMSSHLGVQCSLDVWGLS